jgi:hypothetical protein
MCIIVIIPVDESSRGIRSRHGRGTIKSVKKLGFRGCLL